MNKPKDYLTTKQLMKKYGISSHTLQNWRRGYFLHYGKKYSYLEADEPLPHKLNTEVHPQRIEYNPIKVAVWVAKMKENRRILKNEQS